METGGSRPGPTLCRLHLRIDARVPDPRHVVGGPGQRFAGSTGNDIRYAATHDVGVSAGNRRICASRLVAYPTEDRDEGVAEARASRTDGHRPRPSHVRAAADDDRFVHGGVVEVT